jgi:hypothetical protein
LHISSHERYTNKNMPYKNKFVDVDVDVDVDAVT